MTMVIPRLPSTFSLSNTQAYLKDPLPICTNIFLAGVQLYELLNSNATHKQ